MADFKIAFGITARTEGGYNPGVNENETFDGIDRGENPHWDGWEIIDAHKKANPGASVSQLNKIFAADEALQKNKLQFYKTNYWDVISLDKVNNQQLSNNLYDCSVNEGEGLAARFLQRACNSCGAHTPLTVDGNIGPNTISVTNSLDPEALFNNVNSQRAAEYAEIIAKQPKKAIWKSSWMGRLLTYKKPA